MTGKNNNALVSEIADVIRAINIYAQRRQWGKIDAYLGALDTDNISRVWVTAWLRMTYPYKSKLKNWDDALNRARVSFGEDETLLKGLY